MLDTNVVSALRMRGRNPAVEAWASAIPVDELFVSAFTVAEIEAGVTRKERTDPAQGEILRSWLMSRVLPAFAGRVLPFDLAAARVFATYRVPEHAPADDALIASVAEANGMVVATRNVAHFVPLGVGVVDPWLPPGE
nr:type II toxin-antitoxin system VapC family toxin [Nocardioides flavescens]